MGGKPRQEPRALSAWQRLVSGSNMKLESCFVWKGSDSGNGYGRISINGKTKATHIFAYEKFFGPVPSGKVLDHTCRNRRCWNPKHLKPITALENTLIGEGPTAINARKTHCLNGHEFNEENTYVRFVKGRKQRTCRACKRDRAKRRREKFVPLGCSECPQRIEHNSTRYICTKCGGPLCRDCWLLDKRQCLAEKH